MMNLTYAGTHLTNGVPDNDTSCVTAFEQAGFIMGTSASLFNVRDSSFTYRHWLTWLLSIQQALDTVNNKLQDFDKDGQGLLYTLQRQLRSVRTRADDVANWPSVSTFLGLILLELISPSRSHSTASKTERSKTLRRSGWSLLTALQTSRTSHSDPCSSSRADWTLS